MRQPASSITTSTPAAGVNHRPPPLQRSTAFSPSLSSSPEADIFLHPILARLVDVSLSPLVRVASSPSHAAHLCIPCLNFPLHLNTSRTASSTATSPTFMFPTSTPPRQHPMTMSPMSSPCRSSTQSHKLSMHASMIDKYLPHSASMSLLPLVHTAPFTFCRRLRRLPSRFSPPFRLAHNDTFSLLSIRSAS
ncbi:hypothetical protein BDQ17DRAFT_1085094 [Cyathus striatus]|nr:hypothetical protein BDQ17DRAFT_1085094 [Cyathus striatus]